jgi:trk system potassium uptake protein
VHVIVAGCGRVGATLARGLDAEGHHLVVIDKDQRAFDRLEEGYRGRRLQGIAFDRDTMEEAGIKQAQVFVAVTNGDNSNIVSARTARDHFDVEHVIARIYDPERAGIYERLGIVTVASARWTVDEIRRSFLPESGRLDVALGAGAGEVVVLTASIPPGVPAFPVARLNEPGRCVVAAVTREGRTEVPPSGGLAAGGDRVHLAVSRDAADEVRARVAALGEDER